MNDPQLILADEPTGNLDERNSGTIQELLFDLVRSYGKSMILVTHASDFASMGDEHYILEHRRLRRL
jgi:ABC-type lipoprotein export system ATPase subunit